MRGDSCLLLGFFLFFDGVSSWPLSRSAEEHKWKRIRTADLDAGLFYHCFMLLRHFGEQKHVSGSWAWLRQKPVVKIPRLLPDWQQNIFKKRRVQDNMQHHPYIPSRITCHRSYLFNKSNKIEICTTALTKPTTAHKKGLTMTSTFYFSVTSPPPNSQFPSLKLKFQTFLWPWVNFFLIISIFVATTHRENSSLRGKNSVNQLLSVFHKEPKQRAPHYFAHTYLSLFCSKTVIHS